MDVGKAELSGLNKSVKCLGLFSLFTLGEANAEDSRGIPSAVPLACQS
jgi:hypothetical protein